MGRITQTLIKFFQDEEGWQAGGLNLQHINVEGGSIFSIDFPAHNSMLRCYACADDEAERFRFYTVCPLRPQGSMLQAVAQFIIIANYGLDIGNFELHLFSGEIRYKTSIRVKGECLSSSQIKYLAYTSIRHIDDHLPSILAVISGKVSPEQAIDQMRETNKRITQNS